MESEREETRPLLFNRKCRAKRDEGREAFSSPWILLRRLLPRSGGRVGEIYTYIYIYKQRWDGGKWGRT